jgi:hypothetical protein
MSVSIVSREIYPNRLNQIKAAGLLLAVMFKNGVMHIPDTLTPETTEEEFAEFDREGLQEFARLSVRFSLNDPKFDQYLDPRPKMLVSSEAEQL